MKKRYCPECGRSIPIDARLCPYCAKTVPMHDAQIIDAPEEKKDKTVLIIVAVIIIILIVPMAIAATVYVYVSGMMDGGPSIQQSTPAISFSKIDTSSVNTLTVVSADPADLSWSDLELRIDSEVTNHGLYDLVRAGDVIDLTPIAGDGEYVISIIHEPSNTLICSFDFT